MEREPSFATNTETAAYYEQRAPEYDEWYRSEGRFVERQRPGWAEAVAGVQRLLGQLPAADTLDVACGTGFLTRHLLGRVVGIDQSASMVTIANGRIADGQAIVGDALRLPFSDLSFDRVFTGHFYGHLPPEERAVFLAETRRVGRSLVVVDSALRPGVEPEEWQERILNDGSAHRVYKRHLTVAQLADEIGGHPMLEGNWFVAAQASW